MLETVTTPEGAMIATIIRKDYRSEGIEFMTPDSFSQQLAYMNRPEGYRIRPHYHNKVERTVERTLEVLFIKSGRVRVDLYDNEKTFLQDIVLEGGDVILLASGGHGFTMLEPTEMIEVKQGPYAGENDKTIFDPAPRPPVD